MGSLSLLQRIFLTRELNRGLLHCRQILYQLTYNKHKEEQNCQETHKTVPGLRVEFPLAKVNEKRGTQASERGTNDHHMQEALFY